MAQPKKFRVQNIKTGKITLMTQEAIKNLRDIKAFKEFEILPEVSELSKSEPAAAPPQATDTGSISIPGNPEFTPEGDPIFPNI